MHEYAAYGSPLYTRVCPINSSAEVWAERGEGLLKTKLSTRVFAFIFASNICRTFYHNYLFTLFNLRHTCRSSNSQAQPGAASSQQPAASSQQPAASSQQPAASSQQPAASSQQPAASSQQPAASSQQPAINVELLLKSENSRT